MTKALTYAQDTMLRRVIKDADATPPPPGEFNFNQRTYGRGNTTARVLIERGLAFWEDPIDVPYSYYIRLLPTEAGRDHYKRKAQP